MKKDITNKIVNTLEQNCLYEDEDLAFRLPACNNIDAFFDKYKKNNSRVHNFPKNITRDHYGYIELDEMPFLVSNVPSDGHSKAFWILLQNGSKILLKEDEYYNQMLELMYMELCNQLNMPCAKYDVAKFENKTYIASQSFLKQDEFLVDVYNFDKKRELLEIDYLIKRAFKYKDEERMLKTVFIDTLTNNKDRFSHNFTMISNGKGLKPSPLYDNGGCCDAVDKAIYQLPSYEYDNTHDYVFYGILKSGIISDWIKDGIKNINVEKIAEELQKKKGIIPDGSIFVDFNNAINENLDSIKCLIKKDF